jgi:hypothetical protein
MERPVQWMTPPELRDELHGTEAAWETTDLDVVLTDGQLPVLSKDAHRHQEIVDKLFRRPNHG